MSCSPSRRQEPSPSLWDRASPAVRGPDRQSAPRVAVVTWPSRAASPSCPAKRAWAPWPQTATEPPPFQGVGGEGEAAGAQEFARGEAPGRGPEIHSVRRVAAPGERRPVHRHWLRERFRQRHSEGHAPALIDRDRGSGLDVQLRQWRAHGHSRTVTSDPAAGGVRFKYASEKLNQFLVVLRRALANANLSLPMCSLHKSEVVSAGSASSSNLRLPSESDPVPHRRDSIV